MLEIFAHFSNHNPILFPIIIKKCPHFQPIDYLKSLIYRFCCFLLTAFVSDNFQHFAIHPVIVNYLSKDHFSFFLNILKDNDPRWPYLSLVNLL